MVNKEYFGQIVRSSSSVGVRYRAAKRANSDPDFINKLKIVEEETDESDYFLNYLVNSIYHSKKKLLNLLFKK
mgnify:CR=1 FL=1